VIITEVLFAILYANLLEYAIHRYLFHGLGKDSSSMFAFHLREHHIISIQNGFVDKRVSKKELIGIVVAIILHSPIIYIYPAFFYSISAYGIMFVVIHNLLHSHPKIAKRFFWWHWNHHMRNQNKSWAVVIPITDVLTGTLQEKTKNDC